MADKCCCLEMKCVEMPACTELPNRIDAPHLAALWLPHASYPACTEAYHHVQIRGYSLGMTS